ncbi:MAG: integrase repeat-containing protein [Candidatus Nitrosopolaris sp.]
MKYVPPKGLAYRPFVEARKFARTLGLKTRDEWNEYCTSGKKPDDIPSYPEFKYKNDWKGVGDWLGTGSIASYNMIFRPFDDARKFVHELGLKSLKAWTNYCKSGSKPADIPSNPNKTYGKDWKDWGNWLGSGNIAPQKRLYLKFEEGREFVQSLGLKSQAEWANIVKRAESLLRSLLLQAKYTKNNGKAGDIG